MIALKDVRKVFNAGRPSELLAVDGVSLTIEGRKITVLKGPSGSGKTTLLSIIGCMARPTSGRVELSGREITSLTERFLTRIRRESFGFIFQRFNLVSGITVLENVMLPAYPTGEQRPALQQRAMDLLAQFNLAQKAGAKVEWLSGGEAQRAAIARALINNPSVVIADEPTAHLDTKLSHEFMESMEALREEGRTVIIASHDPLVCEAAGIDRIVGMRDGKLDSREP
ncbi:MAG: ABC transporter ATP-binding protein [Nitrospirales bacterium]|nr:ABC transporter ATP-binding protein [Nitrospirales bacterium]